MERIKFDFNNMFSHNIGTRHGVTSLELKQITGGVRKAIGNLNAVIKDDRCRTALGLEWVKLPDQDRMTIKNIQDMGEKIALSYENVISLGIGGSYLGLKAAQDALCRPYYNEFDSVRKNRPKIYFEGNNLDPDTLSTLLDNLNPKKTFIVVISKSGETTETKAAFGIVESWLKNGVGDSYGRQIAAITDPRSGALREKVRRSQANDPLSFRSLPVQRGVGGRFSELNVGLLHLAIIGIDIGQVLAGARAMSERSFLADIFRNPPAMYAALNTILYRKKGKCISVMLPFSETLKSTADWYVQLLAESLGKKYSRTGKAVNVGRTPVSARGTNDLHSIQQNNVEGENNKTVTIINVKNFENDLKVPGSCDFISGKKYSELLSLAAEATEWALAGESRPSCSIIMPRISPFHWGYLLFFFEMSTAIEGELLNVNTFDQPGVEGYKNYMYYKLRRPDISKEIADKIKNTALKKNISFII